ncbi:DNase I-like protein [Martensiomyces pterosporus]|nr:DNase I-like protein [Martensiomyces pterosporus]
MSSGDEDPAPPRTLAERIARLGLQQEAGNRPTSRTSIRLNSSNTDNAIANEAPIALSNGSTEKPAPPTAAAPKPPVAPKPRVATKPQQVTAASPLPGAIRPQSSYSRATTPAVQAQHRTAQGAGNAFGISMYPQSSNDLATFANNKEGSEEEEHVVSVKDRIRGLNRSIVPEDAADESGPAVHSAAPRVFTRASSFNSSTSMSPATPALPHPALRGPMAERSSHSMPPLPPPLPSSHKPLSLRDSSHSSFHASPSPLRLGGSDTASPNTSVKPAHAGPPLPPPKPAFASSAFPSSAPATPNIGSGNRQLHVPPRLPPKPAGIATPKGMTPNFLKRASYSGGMPSRVQLPPPPPPPPPPLPPPPSSQAHALEPNMTSPMPTPGPMPISMQPTGPRQGQAPPAIVRQPSIAKQSSATLPTGTAASSSAHPSLRPTQPDYRLSNRRPPSLGVQPTLGSDTTPAPVISCLSGKFSVSRLMCTKVDTGEICAIHNTPGPEERFIGIAPCMRIWACTSFGRLLVLNTSSANGYTERLESSSHASIVRLLSAGIGEVWTLHDDGTFEVWRDRSVDGGHDQPLTPLRSFSIAPELHTTRRIGARASLMLLYQRELWFSGGRCVWVFDTHRLADDQPGQQASILSPAHQGQASFVGAPHLVSQLTLTTHDANISCLASNVPYLDEARIGSRGFVFAGTDAGHIIVWKASTYERWRTVDMSNGTSNARITALTCVSDRWLWVGFGSGKLRRDTVWAVIKEWMPVESAVTSIHVDWTPLLTERARLQVASAHANGSVYYWDGSLAMDWQYNELRRRTPEHSHTRDITVQINSWNIDAIKPENLERSQWQDDRQFLRAWLGVLNPQQPEIIVVGLQEVVDLESKKMTAKSLWMNTAVAKHKHKGKGTAKPVADISKRYGLWKAALEKALAGGGAGAVPYRAMECQNMVGLFVCIFAREDICRSVHDIAVSQVKTGLGGLHGNKGGIGVRFVFDDTSFCFINAHLAAGESVRNNHARVEHCTTIVKSLSFKRSASEYQSLTAALPTSDLANISLDAFVDGGDGQRYLDHAACFFSGDLNFRLRLSRAQAERCLDMNDLDTLMQYDQLLPLITSDAHSKQPAVLSHQSSVANIGSESSASTPSIPPNRIGTGAFGGHGQSVPIPVQQPYEDSQSTLYQQPESTPMSPSSSAYSSGDEGEDEGLEKMGTVGFALRSFREMQIQFRPTYKYDPGTDRYDSSEKHRTPAWCDRVLYRGGSGRLQIRSTPPTDPQQQQQQQQQQPEPPAEYDVQGQVTPLIYHRLECKLSDHRPIVAAFKVKVKAVDRDARRDVSVDIRRAYESRVVVEMAAFAKLLWLNRYTANMTRSAELLARANGDLQQAIQSLYH